MESARHERPLSPSVVDVSDLRERLTSWRRQARRAVLRRRRPLAAILVGVAVLAGLSAVRGPQAPGVEVLVAAHDLAAGTTLATGDLTRVRWPAGSVPTGAVRQAGGRVLASPLRSGEPVTDVRLLGPALSEDPDVVAVPVRLPDAASVGLLTVGDHLDLVAADPQGAAAAREVARDVAVLAVPATSEGDSSAGAPGRLVVLGVPVADVADVAQGAVSSYMTFVWSTR